MGLQLDGELVAMLEELLGVLGGANTGGSTGENDSSRRQGGALGQEADELGHVEDQITVRNCWSAFILVRIMESSIRRDIRQGAVLKDLSVLRSANVELAGIRDLSGGNEDGTCESSSISTKCNITLVLKVG